MEYQEKLSHLAVLARALLPDDANASEITSRLTEILDEDEDDDVRLSLPLQQIRLAALSSKNHEQTWRHGSVPPFKYSVGDLGYIPEGQDFSSFRLLQNVVKDGLVSFEVLSNAIGWQGAWQNGFRERHDLQPFPAPFSVCGYVRRCGRVVTTF